MGQLQLVFLRCRLMLSKLSFTTIHKLCMSKSRTYLHVMYQDKLIQKTNNYLQLAMSCTPP